MKDQIRALLKSIETGDPKPIAVVNEEKYIQHNPHKGITFDAMDIFSLEGFPNEE